MVLAAERALSGRLRQHGGEVVAILQATRGAQALRSGWQPVAAQSRAATEAAQRRLAELDPLVGPALLRHRSDLFVDGLVNATTPEAIIESLDDNDRRVAPLGILGLAALVFACLMVAGWHLGESVLDGFFAALGLSCLAYAGVAAVDRHVADRASGVMVRSIKLLMANMLATATLVGGLGAFWFGTTLGFWGGFAAAVGLTAASLAFIAMINIVGATRDPVDTGSELGQLLGDVEQLLAESDEHCPHGPRLYREGVLLSAPYATVRGIAADLRQGCEARLAALEATEPPETR